MENLPWILLVLACPIGMLLMGAIMWIGAKGSGLFGRKESEQRQSGGEIETQP